MKPDSKLKKLFKKNYDSNLTIKKDAQGRCDISGPLEGYLFIFRDLGDVEFDVSPYLKIN